MINSRELCKILKLKSHLFLIFKIKRNLKKSDYCETDDGSLEVNMNAARLIALYHKNYDAFFYLTEMEDFSY